MTITSEKIVLDTYLDTNENNTRTEQQFQQEGVKALNDLFTVINSELVPSEDLLSKCIGALQDINVRDWALGSQLDTVTAEIYNNSIEALLAVSPTEYQAPMACLLAKEAYITGNIKEAYRLLDIATVSIPSYSLTSLLRRVFGSGWPAGAFVAMTHELHPKVCEGIFGE